jgi:hypothetical protein
VSTKCLDSFLLGSYGGFEIFSFLFCDGCKKNKCNLFLFLSGLGLRAWQTTRNLCKFT